MALFVLFQPTRVSATIHTDSNCCQPLAASMMSQTLNNPVKELSSTPPKQIQILFNDSKPQMAAKDRRILFPFLATGLLTLLAFVRI